MIITDFDREVWNIVCNRELCDEDSKNQYRIQKVKGTITIRIDRIFSDVFDRELKKMDKYKNHEGYLDTMMIERHNNKWFVIVPKDDLINDRGLIGEDWRRMIEDLDSRNVIKILRKRKNKDLIEKWEIEMTPERVKTLVTYNKLMKG